ncbi:MAG: mandelate racemase/muconate lactonizing enzyme family protein [Gaiellaceae bacterium]
MSSPETIAELHVATVRAQLPEPIHFGDWVMKHREFALVRVRARSGAEGFGFTLSREGPVAATIGQAIAHHYVGSSFAGRDDAERTFYRCQGSNLAALSGGIGLRALSIVDLAVHDLLARSAGISIARYLGGEPRKLPATAIIGYPPAAMPPDAVREQVSELSAAGWRRFKIPIALPLDYGRDRLLAAREAAGDEAWLGMDAAWVFRSVDDAVAFLDDVRDARLGWFEDVFPPGDAKIVADLRARAGGTAIAMGDEQGGSYYPEALLLRSAVDVVRIDLTCMGGITRAQPMIDACEQAATAFSPHMFAHVHSQVFGGLGHDVPVEWGVPGTGVDQFADSLARPAVVDGLMEPFPEEPGFGTLVNPEWLAEQDVDDPDGLVRDLQRTG